MVAEVQWLDQAKDDLRELLDFIAHESPQAAENYVSELQSACARLEEFPLSGRSYDHNFRALIFRNHIIFHVYDESTQIVSIVMVVDGRRDIGKLIEATSLNVTLDTDH